MTIKQFIQEEVLLPRLKTGEVLVVYDPARLYRELCLDLASTQLAVVDATESSIKARERALSALQELCKAGTEFAGVLVYVPAPAPVSDEDRQRDPFAIYGVCGAVFPDGDGDEYLSICLKAKPDHTTEIRRIFGDNPSPPFKVIDVVGSGTGWPNLEALLDVESARGILFALLSPSGEQLRALRGEDAWVSEARFLLQGTLGMQMKTRRKSWSAIADELWRFLLFSEFVFDLPDDLPVALADVPRAYPEARLLVDDTCDRLRKDDNTKSVYIERAEGVENELNLPAVCAEIADLGVRDTFPFEERSFFAQAVTALADDRIADVREILKRHSETIWVGRGENQIEWALLQSAASLIDVCEEAGELLPERTTSQDGVIDFYASSLRNVDRSHREFERAERDLVAQPPGVEQVIDLARSAYRQVMDRAQRQFVRYLERSGWPPSGRLDNADVFDKLVAPLLLESGRRVALLLIDALRYELGVELGKQLSEDYQAETQVAFARLPSTTSVGMASLLPGAGQDLMFLREDGRLVVALGDRRLTSVAQRMDVLRTFYGHRFAETTLEGFVRDKYEPPEAAELLVIRSTMIDSSMESAPRWGLQAVHDSLRLIRVAVNRLASLGFQEAFIVTDHGFQLNTTAGAGDVCTKPKGDWLNIHERLLLGSGVEDTANFVVSAEGLGVRGDFDQVAGPRALVAYRAGTPYFHGGASLQELVVPVIRVRLRHPEERVSAQLTVEIMYRHGATRTTTRLPVVEVTVSATDLLLTCAVSEILLEAHDSDGKVVGEAKPGGRVNPATGTLSIEAGTMIQVALKMDREFEGKFTVKALNPTTLATLASLSLETDYTV